MVFLIHYISRLEVYGKFVVGIVSQFYLSLHIFFVLSGFLICYRYYDKLEFSKPFLIGYFLKRFARVYPLYFIFTTLFFIDWHLRGLGGKHLWHVYLLNITFIRGFSSKFIMSGIFPAWSLSVEETFYIFSPIIFMIIKRKNIFFLQVCFFWFIGGLLLWVFRRFPFEGFFSSFYFVFFATFFGRCFEFFAGIWLALFVLKKQQAVIIDSKKASAFFTYGGVVAMALVILTLFGIMSWFGFTIDNSVVSLIISNVIFPIAIVIFFYGLIYETSYLKTLLSTRFFQILGRSSYAFFLIHTGLIAFYIEKYVSNNLVMIFIVLQFLSVAIYMYIEHPLDRWIRRMGDHLIKKRVKNFA